MIKPIVAMFIITLFLNTSIVFAKNNIIYKFKKYEKIDLGSLEVQGKILSPGDITITETSHQYDERKIFTRIDFNDLHNQDIKNFR